MKKHLFWIPVIILLACLLALPAFAESEATEPAVSIDKFNLQFEDNVYILYAVNLTGADANALPTEDFGMLFWRAPDATYTMGSEETSLSTAGWMEIDGTVYWIFQYTELAAKEMTDDVYARAYVTVDGTTYYSTVEKYSILQYAYNMLGKTASGSDSEALKILLSDMLTYGASAQNYFGYHTDRLATDDYYQVKVNGGTLASDGSTHGLFREGEAVEITAPEEITVTTDIGEETVNFSHWENSAEEVVGEDLLCTVTVGTSNETYTAVYDTPDSYFVFAEIRSGTGAGTYIVEAADVSNLPEKVVIPAIYNGSNVTTLSPNAFQGSSIIKVFIPHSVTAMKHAAFKCCKNLTSITIPKSITSIAEDAFYECSSLTSITIPDGVTSIGDSAFYGCSNLTSITIPNSVTSIGKAAFSRCSSLTSITVDGDNPNYQSIDGNLYTKDGTMLYQYAIGKADTSFVIPGSVTNIGEEAFLYCHNLTSITIPDSVTNIGGGAFLRCSNLTSIAIPDGVTSIDNSAFYGCSNLTSIKIPDGVTSIGNYAFQYCANLTNLTIPDSVTTIGYEVFTGCKVTEYENGVGYVDKWAVYSYTDITSVTLRTNTVGIGNALFKFRYRLASVTIPDSVIIIGDEAFRSCSSLTSITIGDGVTSIGANAFYECDSLTSVTIPDSVTSIGASAFCGCDSLTSVTIPDSVTSIGDFAFSHCSRLTSITIGDGETSIGANAFYRCDSLTSVTIGDGVTSIGDRAFKDCKSLTSITIPDSVTSIGNSAFSGCTNLTSITIPDSVTSIGPYAFDYSLSTIYYNGTADEWDKISIDSTNNYILISATIYYYSEAEPTDDGNYWRYVDGVPTAW